MNAATAPARPATAATSPFTVLIPARLASSRLPNKPLADIAGLPMVVRVARRAAQSATTRVVVAADDEAIVQACAAHGVGPGLPPPAPRSGSDRLPEPGPLQGLAGEHIADIAQGEEPLIPPALIAAVAALLPAHPEASMGTAAHAIASMDEYLSPHVVKVVLDARGLAHYFSRAPIPYARDHAGTAWWQTTSSTTADAAAHALPAGFAPLRHIGIYSYRAGFLRQFPTLAPAPTEQVEALEQLRALWHGHRIAVHLSADAPAAGVDTPADLQRVRALLG